MKALIEYNDKLYLVESSKQEVNFSNLFHAVNEGKWPDECHPIEWIKKEALVICWLNNEAELLE